jgi:hypothetical protein
VLEGGFEERGLFESKMLGFDGRVTFWLSSGGGVDDDP